MEKINISVPRLNPNDEELLVVDILITKGQKVNKGQKLCIFETTKTAVDFESEFNGFITKILIEKDKYYSEPYGALIQNYMFYEPKSYEKAEKYAKDVLAFNKDRSFYHVMLGDVYRAQDKLEEAAKKYDDAFNTGTNNWLSAAKAGHAYTMFNPEEARKRFDQAVDEARTNNQKIGPKKAKIYTHLHQNNFQKALGEVALIKTSLANYDFSDQEIQSQMSDLLWHEYFIHSHSGQYALAKNALKENALWDAPTDNYIGYGFFPEYQYDEIKEDFFNEFLDELKTDLKSIGRVVGAVSYTHLTLPTNREV